VTGVSANTPPGRSSTALTFVIHADDDLLPRLAAEYEARGQQVALLGTRTRAGDVVLFENDLPDHYP